jgi:hypothetical protein
MSDIYAKPGDTFASIVGGAPAGEAGVRIENLDGTTQTARSTTAIAVVESGSGVLAKGDLVAPDDSGDYIVLWDVDGEDFAHDKLIVSVSHPASVPDPLGVSWRPALPEVAALVRARLKNEFGNELETFSAATRPTADQAELYIDLAVRGIASRIGTTDDLCTDELNARASGLAALKAAMLIELTHYPEQVARGASPYKEYAALFKDGVKAFLEQVAEDCGGGGGGDAVGGDGAMPSFDFSSSLPRVGTETRW